MLVHVHINILDNINLADVANEFVDRKDSSKQKFRHFSQNFHNICKINLTSSYFLYIYICFYFLSNVRNADLCKVLPFIK